MYKDEINLVKMYTYLYFKSNQEKIFKDVINNNARIRVCHEYGRIYISKNDDISNESNLHIYDFYLNNTDEYFNLFFYINQPMFLPTPYGVVNIRPEIREETLYEKKRKKKIPQ